MPGKNTRGFTALKDIFHLEIAAGRYLPAYFPHQVLMTLAVHASLQGVSGKSLFPRALPAGNTRCPLKPTRTVTKHFPMHGFSR